MRREHREKNTSPATSQPEGLEDAATCSSNADVETPVFDNSSSYQSDQIQYMLQIQQNNEENRGEH